MFPLLSQKPDLLCVFVCVHMSVFIWAGVHAHVRIHLIICFLSNISYFLKSLFKFWGCSMFICQSCRRVSSILHLCVKQRGVGGVGVGERDMAWRSRRREPAQVRWGRKWQEGGADVHCLSSRWGTDGRRGREELRGLVGWRRWGSPTARHTDTHKTR